MRVVLVGLVLLAILAGSLLWLRGDDAGEPSADAPPPSTLGADPADPASKAASPAPTDGSLPELPPPASVSLRAPADLAPGVTACLQVLDADSGQPLADAAVYRFHRQSDEAALTYTDAQGLAPLPLTATQQLVVARAGYLLRLSPTAPGSSAQLPQLVRLVADRWSLRCRFRFVLPDGSAPTEVRALVRPLQGLPGQPAAEPIRCADESAAVQRAWSEQSTIAALMAVPEAHVQVGRHNADRLHLLAGEDQIACTERGSFELLAATADGCTGRLQFDSAAAAGTTTVVQLVRGGSIRGVVHSSRGGPAAGAQVAVQDGDPLQLVAHADAQGRFAIGPLPAGAVVLAVGHPEHEAATARATVGDQTIVVQLTALPGDTLRGRVRAQPTLRPLAGATVSMLDALGQPVTTSTAADGSFALRIARQGSARVNVAAAGFLTWSELVDAGAGALDYDLWPGETSARVDAGITAVLQGVLVDEHGEPLAGLRVRFQPDQPPPPVVTGRRVLAGAALGLPLVATTADNGAFELETACSGWATLTALDGAAAGNRGTRIEVRLGQRVTGIRVAGQRTSR